MASEISSHYVNVAVKGATSKGVNRALLLERAGINVSQLERPGSTVTPQQLSLLYKTLWVVLQDEFFGLGKAPCKLGFFRLMASQHPRMDSLRSALEYSSVFFHTTRDDVLFKVEEDDDLARLTMTIDCADTDLDCFIREYHLIGWQRYISWLIGGRIRARETGLNFPEPPHGALYRNFFEGNYRFEQSGCYILFDARQLDRPVVRSHSDLQRYLDSLPLPVFFRPSEKQQYTASVIEVLERFPLDELPTLGQTAQLLGLQPRTLHRKLCQEHTSFRQITNEFRVNAAIDLMTTQGKAVNETSFALGFSEPAAFCHFFKRQTGLSPSQYARFNERAVLPL